MNRHRSWNTGDYPNLDSDGSCPGFTITADPLLGPLQDNSVDQRGVSRAQGLACDIGAFELEVETEPISGLAATNDSPTALGETTTLTATVASGICQLRLGL
jgi:hypothetical protein